MAEIFAIAAAATALLEQSLKLFNRLRSAVNSPKDLPKLVERHTTEISHVKGLIELVEAEDALKTEKVNEALTVVDSTGEVLKSYLSQLANRLSKSGRGQQVVHAMFKGSEEDKKLRNIMADLSAAKMNLTTHILLANVGLTRGVDNSIKANTFIIQNLDCLIKEKLGSEDELRIAKVVRGRLPSEEGFVTLTTKDLESLALEDSVLLSTDPKKSFSGVQSLTRERIITNNETFQYALQINTPVEETDLWAHMDKIIITGNKAHDESTQINYPMRDGVFLEMLRIREQGRNWRKEGLNIDETIEKPCEMVSKKRIRRQNYGWTTQRRGIGTSPEKVVKARSRTWVEAENSILAISKLISRTKHDVMGAWGSAGKPRSKTKK